MLRNLFIGCILLVFGFFNAHAQDTEEQSEALTAALADYTVTGETKNCIRLSSIWRTKVVDNKNIIFEMTGDKEYLNTLSRECHGLSFEESFSHSTTDRNLCSVDYIVVTRRGSHCGLGKFIELTKN